MKKGFSLVALVATIVIMSILLTTVTISGIATTNNAKKISFATEISMIKESVDSYLIKSNGEFPVNDIVQLDVSNVSPSSKTQFTETITNNMVSLFQIDYKLLGLTNLKYGLGQEGSNDVYLMSRETKNVYYGKGLAVGSKTYYTLTNDLKTSINYKTMGSENVANNGVVFIPSNVSWTKNVISVIVKIPKYYDGSQEVTYNSNPVSSVSLSSSDEYYNIYNVPTINENYTITASYSIGSQPATSSKYIISNIDKIDPTIILDSNQNIIQDQTKNSAYIKVNSKNDNLSGVKVIKYENDEITGDIGAYFRTNGQTVSKDVITITKNVKKITVYIQDNAGNYSSKVVTISDYVQAELLRDTTIERTYAKDGLILYYDAINNTGNGHSTTTTTWKDLSGNNNDGILSGFALNTDSGWTGDGLSFKGASDYVSNSTFSMNANAGTVEVVASFIEKGDWTSGNFDMGHIARLGVNNNMTIYAQKNPDASTIKVVSFGNTPRYLCVTNNYSICNSSTTWTGDGSTATVRSYYGGIYANSLNDTINSSLNTPSIMIGSTCSGIIKSVRVYNRVLTDIEIKQNYMLDKTRFGI